MKSAFFFLVTLLLALFAAFLVLPAQAAEVLALDTAEVGIRLHDKICLNADLAGELHSVVPGVRVSHAEVTYKRLELVVPGCWVPDGDNVILADKMGNAGFLSRSDFRVVYAF